ncbi:GTP-binding protein Rhes [Pholidichthys leucotaenia]
MNTTERFYLPVDGILEMLNSLTGHHQSGGIATTLHGAAALSPALQHLREQPPQKTAKGCWREEDERAAASRASCSSDRLPKRSVDLLELGLTKPRNCLRMVVLGAPRVGKTNIIRRFLGKEFEEGYEPTIEDFHRKLFHIRGEAYQVDLLDAPSERDFPAKRRLSILTGDIFLLVFSFDDRESLNEVCKTLNDIKAAKAKLLKLKHPTRAPVVVCGNKLDLDSQKVVRRSEVGKILGEDVPFFETSAKNGIGLEGVFRALASLGGLPQETSPSRHQLIPILTYQSLYVGQRGRRGSRARALGAPCAAVDPLARRPSFNSDLRLVLGSSTKHNKPEKCQIQ